MDVYKDNQNNTGINKKYRCISRWRICTRKERLKLRFRGSSNQRVINVQKTLKEGKIVKYME